MKRYLTVILFLIIAVAAIAADEGATYTRAGLLQASLPWWGWAALLFGFTLLLGIIAVIGGVGGGVMFVPIVSAVFPFHFDFVRGAGLMVALCGALSATPVLLRRGIGDVRLGLPMALFGSVGSIAGAFLGLALPTGIVEGLLGIAILGIVILMMTASRADFPTVSQPDALAGFLGVGSSYFEESLGRAVRWTVHRMPLGLLIYLVIGIVGGMFGVGAGWANVPALNLLLGAPLKVAVGSSAFIMTLNASAASWVYLNSAAVLPLIAVPSVAGMMLGTRVGAHLLPRVRARMIRYVVIGLLTVSGVRSLVAGVLQVVG